MQRLEKFMAANPKGKWEDWVNAAYFDRVSLSSTGFYESVFLTIAVGFSLKLLCICVIVEYFTNCLTCFVFIIEDSIVRMN